MRYKIKDDILVNFKFLFNFYLFNIIINIKYYSDTCRLFKQSFRFIITIPRICKDLL